MTREEYLAEQKKLNKAMTENASKWISELVRPAVEKYGAIRWRQYTPYFNDGDPCTFSCHVDDYERKVQDEEEGESDYDDEDFTYTYGDKTAPRIRAGDLEGAFKAAFGDHVTVTATLVTGDEGSGIKFDVEEYSHD